MKKLTVVSATLLLLATSAHPNDDCAGGGSIDAAGNECMSAVVVYVPAPPAPLTPQQYRQAKQRESRDAALAEFQARARTMKVAGDQAIQQAALARLPSLSQDGQCAGNSDATGNAC
jgi:hypothetical protein